MSENKVGSKDVGGQGPPQSTMIENNSRGQGEDNRGRRENLEKIQQTTRREELTTETKTLKPQTINRG